MSTPPAWTKQAQCSPADTALFFPKAGQSLAPAKQICRRCPVRRACLEFALTNGERFGVWGGTSEAQRRRYWRSQRSGDVA